MDFKSEQAKSECDWLVMSSVFVANQSSCFFLCSREQIRVVENRLYLVWNRFFERSIIATENEIFSLTNAQFSIVRDVSWHPSKPYIMSSSVSTIISRISTFYSDEIQGLFEGPFW